MGLLGGGTPAKYAVVKSTLGPRLDWRKPPYALMACHLYNDLTMVGLAG